MTTQDLTALYVSAPPALPTEIFSHGEGTRQLVGQSPGYHAPATRLDEPSSLALTLVGVAILAAYRGIFKSVAVPVVTVKAVPKTRAAIKPRRRAA